MSYDEFRTDVCDALSKALRKSWTIDVLSMQLLTVMYDYDRCRLDCGQIFVPLLLKNVTTPEQFITEFVPRWSVLLQRFFMTAEDKIELVDLLTDHFEIVNERMRQALVMAGVLER